MNLLVMSRQVAALAPFNEWLGEVVADARLFADAERASEYSGFREIRPFVDYEGSSLVEFDVLRLNREWPIDRIVATSEADILRAGRLRSHLGLPGQGGESAFAFRNKIEMKNRLKNRGIAVELPAFQEANEGYDIIRFIERHGYPVIVKPVDGFGSINTTVIRSEDELAQFLQHGLPRGLEVETYISGAQYHVDGLVIDGEIVFCWPSKYLRDSLWYANGGITASRMLSPANPLTSRLRTAAEEILRVLPTPQNTSFHLELFHTMDDRLFFCEIASRTGGGLVNSTLEAAFGINVNRTFVRAQAGLPIDVSDLRRMALAPKRLLGFGLVPPQAGTFVGFRGEAPDAPWIVQYDWTMKRGKRSKGPVMAGDRAADFIVEFIDEKVGDDRLIATWKWATENALWEA